MKDARHSEPLGKIAASDHFIFRFRCGSSDRPSREAGPRRNYRLREKSVESKNSTDLPHKGRRARIALHQERAHARQLIMDFPQAMSY